MLDLGLLALTEHQVSQNDAVGLVVTSHQLKDVSLIPVYCRVQKDEMKQKRRAGLGRL